MANRNTALHSAKDAKNDEFYTRFCDIEAEINAYIEYNPDVFRDKTILLPCDDPEWSNFTRYFATNFERFGLKKLISTSYSFSSGSKQISMFEMMSPLFDKEIRNKHGKLFTVTRDANTSGRIDVDDIEFNGYLKGDGDFRSDEVCKLRDEADFIITNPPFSLFREFVDWIVEGNKQFIIMSNKNAINYKEVFPLIQANKMWVGYTSLNGGRWMIMPKGIDIKSDKAKPDGDGNMILNVPGVCWMTNVEHGKKHEWLKLDTKAHNLKYNAKLKKQLEEFGTTDYPHYENYDAIEVPFVECIPSDYEGAMGVPLTFLDKYNPEQFEIIGKPHGDLGVELGLRPYPRELKKLNHGMRDGDLYFLAKGMPIIPYGRILIRRKV
jgi:hypothetical protein